MLCMLGSTTRVEATTPALLALHPLPATHLPPSASWPDGLNRRRHLWKVIMRSRLQRDQLAWSELQLLPRHRLDPANGRGAAGRPTGRYLAAASGWS